MKKTKHFNISVPELGDTPDITQVSNAISDLEDATAGTLEIMKAEMQGTKITLTSVSRKTKRTGYYEGMSIRFKSPQDIEPNYLKTISVDGLGDQTLSVEYKVNRNEYIDIVYEGNKFTAYPVVVQKTDSVSENSSILVGTAKGVKTAYDKGVEALNKANQAQSSANKAQSTADGKVSKNGDTMTGGLRIINVLDPFVADYTTSLSGGFARGYKVRINGVTKSEFGLYGSDGQVIYTYLGSDYANPALKLYHDGTLYLRAKNLKTNHKEVVDAINELNSGKEDKIDKKSGFNLDKSDSVTSNSSNTIATSLAVKTAYDKASQAQSTADGKVSKSGDTMTGKLVVKSDINIVKNSTSEPGLIIYDESSNPKTSLFTASDSSTLVKNYDSGNYLKLGSNGNSYLKANNLKTKEKEVVGAINEMYDSAFISGDRVKYVNTESIGWDAQSGIYKAEQPGATYTMAHFYSGDGSTPAFDIMGMYDGEMLFRTTRDKVGYSDWMHFVSSANFNKYCPYTVGDIYITTRSENPSTVWLGTSWEKIEGRFLLGTSGGVAGTTGGSMSKTISVANLPSHNHSGSQSEHSHYMFSGTTGGSSITASNVKEKAPSCSAILRSTTDRDDYNIAGNNGSAAYGRTSNAGGGVSVGYTGSGSALDITPSYYTVHIWKRRG